MASKKEISDDEVIGKAYDSRLMNRLLKYLKPYRKWVFTAIILTIGVSLSSTIRPYLTKVAIDNYISHKDPVGLTQYNINSLRYACCSGIASVCNDISYSMGRAENNI